MTSADQCWHGPRSRNDAHLRYTAKNNTSFWKHQSNRNSNQQCSSHWQIRISTTLSHHWSAAEEIFIKEKQMEYPNIWESQLDHSWTMPYLKTVPSGKLTNLIKLSTTWVATDSESKQVNVWIQKRWQKKTVVSVPLVFTWHVYISQDIPKSYGKLTHSKNT